MYKKGLSILLVVAMIVLMIPVASVTVSAGSVIESAISWAVSIANDDSHGYSWDGRWGPDYDCSSLVISAFRESGLSLSGATTTVNMRSIFSKEGFTWIPASQIDLSNPNSLIRGDILLNESSHTEIYIGNGQNVGAHRGYMSQWCSHSNTDGKYHRHGHYSLGEQVGDQDGGEISVAGYYNYPWDGVLRYNEEPNHDPIGAWDSIITGGMKRIRVTGWAYDLDDPNASLDIHVYVGGPAGSGAPCYVIKADVYRTDINIGNCRHGFDSYIDVSPTGRQNVYLYAINVGEGQYTELGMKTIDIEGEIASFGYDYPTDNQEITDRTFLFQGWVQANKEIASITCSINDGEKYVTSNLYTRPDVPNATAFRADISTSKLNVGNNKISVCVNFTDGTGVVAGVRTINRTRPTIIAAVDCPVEGQHIDEDTFLFQGWVDADKEIESITVRINNGAYYNLGLYNREDVPYATAFRREFSSDYLAYGDNSFALCVNYKDGTGAVPVIRNFVKDYEVAVDNPINNEVISSEKFLVQGWAVANKEIKSVKCLINGEKYKEAGLYKREDVPFATAFRREIFTNELSVGENTIAIVVEYTDGTSIIARERTVIRECLEPTTSPTESPTTLPTESPTIVNNLLGDADGDSEVTSLDVTFIQRSLAHMTMPESYNETVADVDGDGDVTALDVTFIQRSLAHMTVPYAIGEPIA